jgi:hypothetical protein
VFFYEMDMRLTAPETTVVVGIWLVVVLLARWIRARIRGKAGKDSKVAKGTKTLVIFLISLVALELPKGRTLLLAAAPEQGGGQAQPPPLLACSPDRPVVSQDGTVMLRAWAAVPDLQTQNYTWAVTVGVISGQGREVRWDFKGVPSGIYTADVKVEAGKILRGNCSIRVAVTEPERGTFARESGKAFLTPGQQEAPNYGLYSYVLFGSHPTEASRARYLSTLQAYLGMIDDVVKLEDYVSRSKLNVTYLVLASTAAKGSDATWLLGHYDYARARVFLDRLPGSRKEGIYLVSCLKPLSSAPDPPYLVQDLTAVPTEPPDLISWWMREFLNQASQERFWQPKTTELLALRLRTSIAVLAAGLPEVQKGVDSWIAWIH